MLCNGLKFRTEKKVSELVTKLAKFAHFSRASPKKTGGKLRRKQSGGLILMLILWDFLSFSLQILSRTMRQLCHEKIQRPLENPHQ